MGPQNVVGWYKSNSAKPILSLNSLNRKGYLNPEDNVP